MAPKGDLHGCCCFDAAALFLETVWSVYSAAYYSEHDVSII